MIRNLSCLLLAVGLIVSAGAVGAQITYPTTCKATADGELRVAANITTPLLVDNDFDTTSLSASYAIPSATALTFNDLKDNAAELFRNGFGGGGCVSDIATAIAGQVVHSFSGTTTDMNFSVNSVTIESVSINRQNVTGTGVAITASNSYDVPQATQLNIEVPFTVTGTTNRRLTVGTFSFSRTDTTSTTGSTIGAYQVFADNNSNCTVDTGDSSTIGAAGIVFPNGTYSEPSTQYKVSPGDYVLVLSYFTDVDLASFSPDCNTSTSASGWQVDGFNLAINVQ